jgi:hypothetical protein
MSAVSTLPAGVPDRTLGWEVLWWTTEYIRQPDGPDAGAEWRYTPEQVAFVLWWYSLTPDARWTFMRGVLRRSKGWGKALALDTPLPTPDGWTTMGDVAAGDELLGADSRPTTVVVVSPVWPADDCYAVTFSDGQRIVANAEHLWAVEDRGNDGVERILDTEGLAAMGDDAWRWAVAHDVRGRHLVAVEPVDPVPTACVTVDAADSLFLAGERSVPTHNSPFVASLALAELCGPVRFEAWAAGGERRPWRPDPYMPGEPIGRATAAPWVQLVGTSQKQTDNVMSMVLAMCQESPVVDEYGLDLGLSRIYTPGGVGRLEPITASHSTAEGARPTAVFEDETHLYSDTNGGVKLDQTNRRNVGKSPGGTARVLEATNAHASGEQSVAERSWEAWLAGEEGRSRGGALLYDTDLADEVSLMAGLAGAYGDSTWVDLARIRDEVWDPATPPSEARRFFLNQIATAVDAWLAEPEWAACTDATKVVAHGETVTLGFDGSRRRVHAPTDATALIGCRVADGHLFEVGVWPPPSGPAGDGWEVPATAVEAAVHHAFATWNVVGFFADEALWGDDIRRWEGRYLPRLKVRCAPSRPCRFNMNPTTLVRALAEFHAAVLDRKLTHDGSHHLTQHVLNARRRLVRSGVLIFKEHPESANKIDAAYAATLAWAARLEAVARNVGANQFVPRRVR